MNKTNTIDIRELNFDYEGQPLIRNLSLNIAESEHIAIMGASGVGKSTLLHAIVGLVQPDSGSIFVGGTELTAQNIGAIRQTTAWIPQSLPTPYNTVMELVTTPFTFKSNAHLTFDRERCCELMAQLNLDNTILDKELRALSGGELQRVMIVGALMLEKAIILLDEPTSALDATSRKMVTALLSSLKKCTIVAITHDQEFADTFDRTITLHKCDADTRN